MRPEPNLSQFEHNIEINGTNICVKKHVPFIYVNKFAVEGNKLNLVYNLLLLRKRAEILILSVFHTMVTDLLQPCSAVVHFLQVTGWIYLPPLVFQDIENSLTTILKLQLISISIYTYTCA